MSTDDTKKPGPAADAGKPDAADGQPDHYAERRKMVAEQTEKARTLAVRVIGVICLVFALILAGAALAIALKANEDNALVDFVLGFAGGIDLGIFDLDNPIKGFDGDNADIKTALLNYGLGAIFYLVLGRVAEKLIRP